MEQTNHFTARELQQLRRYRKFALRLTLDDLRDHKSYITKCIRLVDEQRIAWLSQDDPAEALTCSRRIALLEAQRRLVAHEIDEWCRELSQDH